MLVISSRTLNLVNWSLKCLIDPKLPRNWSPKWLLWTGCSCASWSDWKTPPDPHLRYWKNTTRFDLLSTRCIDWTRNSSCQPRSCSEWGCSSFARYSAFPKALTWMPMVFQWRTLQVGRSHPEIAKSAQPILELPSSTSYRSWRGTPFRWSIRLSEVSTNSQTLYRWALRSDLSQWPVWRTRNPRGIHSCLSTPWLLCSDADLLPAETPTFRNGYFS